MNDNPYTIKQAADQLGTTTAVLRRLCNGGFIPHVRRNRRGYRVLEPWQIDHAAILIGLKQAGFQKPDLRRYSQLFRAGDATLAERKALFETQKRQLWQQLEDCQQGIDFLERQIELIDQS